jgi:DNA helicase HerA-like ATPase
VVQVALGMVNRHGLIAGATGTGKTKTLQVMAEQLSAAGVPVFVADVRGDLSGLAAAGDATGHGADRARGAAAVGKFLKSREGKKLENQVVRGVFGLLKKRL